MTGEIISVGTELLLGDVVNTNAAHAARKLAELGVGVFLQTVVGDNPERLKAALERAFARADLVVLTGGLGPTGDDLTKEVTAEYFGLPLLPDKTIESDIRHFAERVGITCHTGEIKQSLVPAGALVFPNRNGTAPGLAIEADGRTAILLPGPPREMEPMFDEQIVPYLQQRLGDTIRSHTVKLFGIGEAQAEASLPEALFRGENPTLAPYAKTGEVELRATAKGPSEAACEALLEPVLETVRLNLEPFIYGIDVPDLQTALVGALRARGLTIATAESLTGGLLSERLTQVPGASTVFGLGVCTYANDMKERVLGVPAETLREYGAVSAQTAAAMAMGVRSVAGADIGVSTTGIAGPDGGTEAKPVGTVYVGIVTARASKVIPLRIAPRGADSRAWIRHMTALNAFAAVLKLISKGDANEEQ